MADESGSARMVSSFCCKLRELLLVPAREALGKHVSASWSSISLRVSSDSGLATPASQNTHTFCTLGCRTTPGLCGGEHSASRNGVMWAALQTGATAVYQGKHAELHPFLLQNLQLFLALCVCMVGCSRMQCVGR